MLVGIQAGHLSLEGKQVWPQEDSADACARIAERWQTLPTVWSDDCHFQQGKGREEAETVEIERPAISVMLIGYGHLT